MLPIWWRHFSHWCSFFPGDFSLCKVDQKLASTRMDSFELAERTHFVSFYLPIISDRCFLSWYTIINENLLWGCWYREKEWEVCKNVLLQYWIYILKIWTNKSKKKKEKGNKCAGYRYILPKYKRPMGTEQKAQYASMVRLSRVQEPFIILLGDIK